VVEGDGEFHENGNLLYDKKKIEAVMNIALHFLLFYFLSVFFSSVSLSSKFIDFNSFY